MLVIHKMATVTSTISLSLFSNYLHFVSKSSCSSSSSFPFLKNVSSKFSVREQFTCVSLYRSKQNQFCTTAVASPESTQTVVDDDNKKLEETTFSEIRIKLPTNESSEKLLKIRHTVSFSTFYCFICSFVLFS